MNLVNPVNPVNLELVTLTAFPHQAVQNHLTYSDFYPPTLIPK